VPFNGDSAGVVGSCPRRLVRHLVCGVRARVRGDPRGRSPTSRYPDADGGNVMPRAGGRVAPRCGRCWGSRVQPACFSMTVSMSGRMPCCSDWVVTIEGPSSVTLTYATLRDAVEAGRRAALSTKSQLRLHLGTSGDGASAVGESTDRLPTAAHNARSGAIRLRHRHDPGRLRLASAFQ